MKTEFVQKHNPSDGHDIHAIIEHGRLGVFSDEMKNFTQSEVTESASRVVGG
jgi:hypothetical protein